MGGKSLHKSARPRLAATVTAAVTAALLAVAASGVETRLYRWVDEDGIVHYTDQIPPNQVERGRTELNELGIPVHTVPAAQTIEEIQRERELERLRAQQERLVDQQRAADRVLLRTFRSVDDLDMALKGKLAAIDVVIGVARSNIRRQQAWLGNLRSEAADLERAGKPVPAHLVESIGKTERYIRDSYAAIVERERQKNDISLEFDRNLKRFRQLKDIPEDGADSPRAASRPTLRNLVTCTGTEQCDRYWARAVAYVRAKSTTPIQTSAPNILITAPPEKREDLSLTLSRIQEKDSASASLFLDLQCKSPSSAEGGCKGERSIEVLDGFREAVEDGGDPGNAPPPP